MATETMSVPRRLWRKRRMTRAMRTERLDDLFLKTVVGGPHEGGLVEERRHLHPGGQVVKACATTPLTASTISIVLPPGTRSTFR